MKRSLLLFAVVGAAVVLGGCSSLSQPEEFRVVKDSPIPAPKPAVANPSRPMLNAGGPQGRGMPQLRRPAGKKSGG